MNTKLTLGAALGAALLAVTACGADESTVRVQDEAPKVPTACVDALEQAEQTMGTLTDALVLSGDLIEAAGEYDLYALERGAERMDGYVDLFDEYATSYAELATECDGEPRGDDVSDDDTDDDSHDSGVWGSDRA